jgi:cytochrome c oxidase cbb3-type subunit 4
MSNLSAIVDQIVDNWTLVFLFSFFVGNALFVFRPGARRLHEDAAQVPFRAGADDLEAGDGPMVRTPICPGCAACAPAINGKEGA